jgi:hypothetical protein
LLSLSTLFSFLFSSSSIAKTFSEHNGSAKVLPMKRILLLLSFIVTACTSHPSAVLSQAESIEIFVLDPLPEQAIQPKLNFHGFRILESATIDASTGATMDTLIQKGINSNTGYIGACFSPRHGVRAKIGNSEYDFVLSFACNQLKVYRKGINQTYLTSIDAEAEFDKIFAAAGIGLTTSKALPKAGGTVEPAAQSQASTTQATDKK